MALLNQNQTEKRRFDFNKVKTVLDKQIWVAILMIIHLGCQPLFMYDIRFLCVVHVSACFIFIELGF